MNETISVIIPLYNGERFIKAALTSVLEQTLLPTEIIVVDDGSTDDGPAIVRARAVEMSMAIATGHPGRLITLLTQRNGGQSSARNFGVSRCTGDYIAFLDQDDLWYSNHLAELIKPFVDQPEGKQLGWVYSEVDEIDFDDNMVTHCYIRTHPGAHPKRDVFECLRRNMYVVPSATLILRRAFNHVGGFDERFAGYEDDDLFLRIFRAGYGNAFVNTALSQWRFHAESSTFTNNSMRRSRSLYLRKWWDAYPDDLLQMRFVRRDLLLPRFYPEALNEYVKALRIGDPADIDETREELLFIVSHLPGLKRKVLAYLLTAMRSPKVMDAVLRMRLYLRPIARRLI